MATYGFTQEGNWYKGNLHCHSTLSDGRLEPDEVAARYKAAGWNFLAFTDHRLYTNHEVYNDDSFLIIPGIEMDIAQPDPCRIYHVVAIQGKPGGIAHGTVFPSVPWEGLESAQSMIQDLTQKDQLTIFCHPIWSRLELGDFVDLQGYFALEIFNYGCSIENHTGLSVDYWDSLLRRGRRVWGIATDDAHHLHNDRCGGWIMVKAPELSHQAIAASLLEGSFYSSSGPEIFEYSVVEGEVSIRCSPVKAIHFVAYESWGHSCYAEQEGTLSAASYRLTGKGKYVRVECVDATGRTAWTNPIFL